MNFEKMTEKARQAIMESQQIGAEEGHQQLDGEHLHLALLTQEDGLIPKLLTNMEVNTGELIADLKAELSKLPKVQGGGDSMYSSRRLTQLFSQAEKIAGPVTTGYTHDGVR